MTTEVPGNLTGKKIAPPARDRMIQPEGQTGSRLETRKSGAFASPSIKKGQDLSGNL